MDECRVSLFSFSSLVVIYHVVRESGGYFKNLASRLGGGGSIREGGGLREWARGGRLIEILRWFNSGHDTRASIFKSCFLSENPFALLLT